MMSQKEIIVQAIKNMDVTTLEVVLEEGRSYMDVSKATFIEGLSSIFRKVKDSNQKAFKHANPGECAGCVKGCKGVSFSDRKGACLDLVFEGDDNEVTDIFLCHDFANDEEVSKLELGYYMSFKEDEMVFFEPSEFEMNGMYWVNQLTKEFEQFQETVTDIEDIALWYTANEKVNYELPHSWGGQYRFVDDFKRWFDNLSPLRDIVKGHYDCISRIQELMGSKEEKERRELRWLLKYKEEENYGRYIIDFHKLDTKTDNQWLQMNVDETVLVDYSEFSGVIEFNDLYFELYDYYLQKYMPTKEQFEENGVKKWDICIFLKLANKHMDLVEDYYYEQFGEFVALF